MVMSPDAEVEEVVEAHLQNAENSCENNSFYLDMYVDERFLIMQRGVRWYGTCGVRIQSIHHMHLLIV